MFLEYYAAARLRSLCIKNKLSFGLWMNRPAHTILMKQMIGLVVILVRSPTCSNNCMRVKSDSTQNPPHWIGISTRQCTAQRTIQNGTPTLAASKTFQNWFSCLLFWPGLPVLLQLRGVACWWSGPSLSCVRCSSERDSSISNQCAPISGSLLSASFG